MFINSIYFWLINLGSLSYYTMRYKNNSNQCSWKRSHFSNLVLNVSNEWAFKYCWESSFSPFKSPFRPLLKPESTHWMYYTSSHWLTIGNWIPAAMLLWKHQMNVVFLQQKLKMGKLLTEKQIFPLAWSLVPATSWLHVNYIYYMDYIQHWLRPLWLPYTGLLLF